MKVIRKARKALGLERKTGAFSSRRVRRLRVENQFIELMKACPAVDKMTEKLYTTYKAAEYIEKNKLAGDYVECGVYKGRHICVMAMTLLQLGVKDRDIYLYDTFAGMTKPGPLDVRTSRVGEDTDPVKEWEAQNRDDHNLIMYASLDSVRQTVYATGYPEEKFHFVAGDIKETVPNDSHKAIALLRLDTDWYELTKHELEHMYDLVVPGGVVIIDDYGSHEGARQAVDEFFAERHVFPLLFRTQKNERAMLKIG